MALVRLRSISAALLASASLAMVVGSVRAQNFDPTQAYGSPGSVAPTGTTPPSTTLPGAMPPGAVPPGNPPTGTLPPGYQPPGSPPPPSFAPPAGPSNSPSLPGGAPVPQTSVLPESELIVQQVKIEGNHTTSPAKLPQLRTRAGQPFDRRIVAEDVRAIASTRRFLDVRSQVQQVPGGMIVIFQVVERPTLQYVTFVGNRDLTTRSLRKKSELKVGDALDPYAVEEARRRLEAVYREKGYNHAQITVIEGNKLNDKGAIFVVSEGKQQRIRWTSFEGNTIADDRRLRTQIEQKPGILWMFGGKVDRKKIDDDVDKLTAYYRSLGFFQAKVGRELHYNADHDWLSLKFIINEGPQYNVRNISFLGNEKFSHDQLSKDFKLTSGKAFDQAKLNHDLAAVRSIYGGEGYIRAEVNAEPRLLEDKPEVDLVVDIREGKPYRIRNVHVNITGEEPHTKHATIHNRMSVRPGDIADTRKIEADIRRLKFASIFNVDPTKGSVPKITFNNFSDGGEELDAAATAAGGGGFRGQSPDRNEELVDLHYVRDAKGVEHVVLIPVNPASDVTAPQLADMKRPHDETARARFQDPGYGGYPVRSAGPDSHWSHPANSPTVNQGRDPWGIPRVADASYLPPGARPRPANTATSAQPSPSAPLYGSSNYQPLPSGAPPSSAPYGSVPPGSAPPETYGNAPTYSPNTMSPSAPVYQGPPGNPPSFAPPANQPQYGAPGFPANGGNGYGPGAAAEGAPIFGQPNMNPLPPPYVEPPVTGPTVDLSVVTEETQTGRLMLGVGVNSDAGLIGNFVLDEQNFDIMRLPRSWEDIRTAKAWRGAGQRFRLEANPGTQVQRYAASFIEPYLLNTPVQLSLSGFYFTRIYSDWTEERLGGKVGLGYAFTPDLTGRVAFRGERVNISNPATPTPQVLAQVLGNNDLYGVSVGMSHDTRDSPFLPTQGHLISGDFEQVTGTWDYPIFKVEGRQYFTTRTRRDGSGKHILGIGGELGFAGANTPIYDNFFAGGFSTLRGFVFRGASPVEDGVIVGGEFMLLGTVEYMFPISADDALRGVLFCDFGTVQEKIALNGDQFRVAPGFGLRINVPAMGPAPLAFDFAFPVAHADTDQIQIFSFFVGVGR